MSRTTWNLDREPLGGLYRDRENGWIFGVCAGIAEYCGCGVMAIRIVTVLSLLLFFVPTALIYLAATVIIRDKPLTYSGQRDEDDFWRCRHRASGERS